MILTTHMVVGGALARAFSFNPPISFAIGLASHYVFDLIPHWEYKLNSIIFKNKSVKNNLFFTKGHLSDFLKIGIDLLIGVFFVWLFFASAVRPEEFLAVWLGALGGVLPDIGQFFYLKFNNRLWHLTQKIHDFFHSGNKLFDNKRIWGLTLQLVIIFIFLLVGNWRYFI